MTEILNVSQSGTTKFFAVKWALVVIFIFLHDSSLSCHQFTQVFGNVFVIVDMLSNINTSINSQFTSWC